MVVESGEWPVVAIFGPTASGKTAIAHALAAMLPGEVVSADSMQVYRGIPILTNQSTRPEHLVAIWPLSHESSVAEYADLAHAAIDGIRDRGRTPVVVGGTGLYLRAALSEMAIPPAPPEGLRQRHERAYDLLGPAGAHRLLSEQDAASAAAIHPNDRRRVVRALELAEIGESLRPAADRLWAEDTRHPTLIVGLDLAPERLAEHVRARAESMYERGVEHEVRDALAATLSSTARQVIGLREVADMPRAKAVEEITRRTLRYAAYQRKWLRRIPGAATVGADRPAEEIAREILEMARARKRLPARRAG